jgi:hypothetical protein
MKSLMLSSIAAATVLLATQSLYAQTAVVTYYAPAVPTTVYYGPAYTVASPVAAAPAGAYFGTTRVYYPAVAPSVRPVVAPVVTRYRPFLGGTVTRYGYRYAPVYYVP